MTPFSSSAGARFSIGSATHTGLVRKENEDAIALPPGQPLWAVADGMGGHARGAWASRTVCRMVERVQMRGLLHDDCEAIADVLADANDMIVAEGEKSGGTIGTTVVALAVGEDRFACLWAGDSRIYLIRAGAIRQLTRDHSQVEELVAAGLITKEAARDHPLGNVVTRAVGVASGLAIDVCEHHLLPSDRFLLCSDGLTKVIDDEEIVRLIGGRTSDAACDLLVRTVLERGAPDNVSVILVDIGY